MHASAESCIAVGKFRHIFGFCVKKLYSIAALIDA